MSEADLIRAIRARTRTVAMIGASERPGRPSNGVMRFLQEHGCRVIPVNPEARATTINGETVAASLADVDGPVDMIDIFRRSALAGAAVDDAIREKDRLGISTVWLQLGVIDDDAKARAVAAGLDVVMDRCPAIEFPKLRC